MDSDFLSENLFCIDNNDVVDDDNNVYISYLYLIVYISIYFQTVNFVLTMAEEEGRKFGWWWSPFRGAQVASDEFIYAILISYIIFINVKTYGGGCLLEGLRSLESHICLFSL